MLKINLTTCLSCTGCIAICPDQALSMDLESLNVDRDLCSMCRFCIRFCPVTAISISRENDLAREEVA